MNEKKEITVCELISDECIEKFSNNDLKLDSLGKEIEEGITSEIVSDDRKKTD